MQTNTNWFGKLALVAASFALATSAQAAIQYDQNVTGGVNYGSGNQNGGFTVDQNAGIGLELGLRAHTRYPVPNDNPGPGGIMSQGNGTYGPFPAATLGPPGRGSWNFDFSINSNFNGSGGSLTSNTYVLSISSLTSAGSNFLSFNPLLIPDNAPTGSTTLAQNSENLGFSQFAIPLNFDPNLSGIYNIVLQAFNHNGGLVGQTGIQVIVGQPLEAVPEPTSIALWSIVGFGGAFYRWRRRQSA